MSNRTFGIIGAGFVGSAVAKGFMLDGEVGLYDVDECRRTAPMSWVCNADYVFICVPTPMRDVEGGRADLSIMDSVFEEIDKTRKEEEFRNDNTIFIIKSTVPVGTTRRYSEMYSFPVVHCPEFLTERTANIDFLIPSRHIIGGVNPSIVSKVENLFAKRFPGISIHTMGPEEAELTKYVCNCFFATKVLFLNEMKLLVDKIGMDWEQVMKGFLSDGRISHSHTQVPGHDGDRGIGGKCFPKDINAMISLFGEHGLDAKQMKATWEQNKAIRQNWDWAKIPGATSKNTKT